MTTGFFSHPDCLLHEMGQGHPECPARLRAIEEQLSASGIDIGVGATDAAGASTGATGAPIERDRFAPLADERALLRVHTRAHLDFLRSQLPAEGHAPVDPDTSMNPRTLQAAQRAAGVAMAATDAVIAGCYANAFCSIRPPGHHAEPARAMGFCFFNNVAIAARHALDVHGLARVAIVDFDAHHGNGTEAVFAGDARVLVCSIFQPQLYPFMNAQDSPNMVNVPLGARTRGMDARAAIDLMWLPRLHEFEPEMVFISAGFDGHREDDMGNLGLVEDDFAWMTEQVFSIAQRYAQGRIVSCLEGGYSLPALGRSVEAHLRVLAGL